jgi:epoxyqueuosine reductase
VTSGDLAQRVKAEARRLGARLVGIASVDRWLNAPKGHGPSSFLPTARSVVSFALPVFRPMTQWRDFMTGSEMFCEEEGTERPHRRSAALQIYQRMQYDAINLNLMSIANFLGCFLYDLGFAVVTPPVTVGSGFANLMVKEMGAIKFAQWSQRHAAVCCGLGELGMNNAVITPEYGLRVRFGSLITDAPLEADPLDRIGAVCTHCRACVEACPDSATFAEEYSYELLPGVRLTTCRFRKELCGGSSCSACLRDCPVGR